jgi:hypothetical protein
LDAITTPVTRIAPIISQTKMTKKMFMPQTV